MLYDTPLERARQACREAYAKYGMSPEYEAAFDAVRAITRPMVLAKEGKTEFFSVDSGQHRTRLLDGRII